MDYRPFTKSEYELVSHFLVGDSVELTALRFQLDSLRYASSLYRPGYFLGFRYHARSIRRRRSRIVFRTGYGYGCEAWELGDRRPIVLGDVVAQLQDDRYVCAELAIDNGLINELRVIGLMNKVGQTLQPLHKSIYNLHPVHYYYTTSWSPALGRGPDVLSDSRLPNAIEHLHPPRSLTNATQFQNWLLSLDSRTILCPDQTIPLQFRRAQPASVDEIDRFQHDNRIVVPHDLRTFWLATNGASFFGDLIYGTYDAVVEGHPGRATRDIIFLHRMVDDMVFITIDAEADDVEASQYSRIHEINVGTQETLRSWSSLQECLKELYEEHAMRGQLPA